MVAGADINCASAARRSDHTDPGFCVGPVHLFNFLNVRLASKAGLTCFVKTSSQILG